MMPDYYNNSQQTWQGPKGASGQGGGGRYVWWDRNWVPFDPNNPAHKGLPQYDQYLNIAPGSTPYYANDVSSALMQNAFPGAAAGYAFGSSYLEPQRQQNIREMLALQTQGGASNASDAYQKSLQQRAYGNAAQAGASLYGPGGGGRQFKASNLLSQMNQANAQGGQYRAQATDPMAIAARRNATITQGFQNPMADAVRGWIPGLEPARQNNNFWGQLAGGLSNFLPYLNYGGGGKGGGGGGGFGGSGSWSLSDRRLKSRIVKVAELKNGLGVYEYDIFGKRTRGVMADEVEKVVPSAVRKAVDYGQLLRAVQ